MRMSTMVDVRGAVTGTQEAVEQLARARAGIVALAARASEGSMDVEDITAVLAEARSMAEAVEWSELQLLAAARARKATWSQLARALGLTGRQGAQKRFSDLARRNPPRPPARELTPEPARASSAPRRMELAQPAPAVPAPEPVAEEETPGPPEARVIPDEEYSASLRHRRIEGLGSEWTYTVDERDNAVVWFKRTTRAGSADRNWPGSGWISLGYARMKIGKPHTSRIKALKYAAESFEYRRRKETPAGADVPLKGAPGWLLRQTLEDRDSRRWQVIAPDARRAGTAYPSWRGARTWTAVYGERVTITPSIIPGSGAAAASHGEEWRTRDAAALALAWYASEGETPVPGGTARPAAPARQRDDPGSAGGPGRSGWEVTEPLPGADRWQLARTRADAAGDRWQVIAPDGTPAGFVTKTAATAGPGTWEAAAGLLDRDDAAGTRVSPGPGDAVASAGGEWASRDAAAYAVAHRHDRFGVDAPDLMVLRARAEAKRSAAPRITSAHIREGRFTVVKSSGYETTGAWDVLVGGKVAGSVRPTWRGGGAARGWEPVDLAGTVMAAVAIGRTTSGGHASSRDAAATALLHGLKRRQDNERKKNR